MPVCYGRGTPIEPGARDRDNELQPNSRGFEKPAAGPRRTALAKYAFAVCIAR